MIDVSPLHNTARLAGTLAFLDTGATHATIQIYAAPRPAAGETPASSPLVVIALAKPCADETAAGLELIGADTLGEMVLTSGDAAWARFVTADGLWALDCDVSSEAGTAEVKLESITLYAGGRVPLKPSVLG